MSCLNSVTTMFSSRFMNKIWIFYPGILISGGAQTLNFYRVMWLNLVMNFGTFS